MQVGLNGYNWLTRSGVSVRGYCYDKDHVLRQGEMLWKYFSQVDSPKVLLERLQQANGLFAVVVNREKWQALAVDKTRVYPLYYRVESGDLYVSDDAHSLVQKGDRLSSTAVREYSASGAPLEGKTLVERILQVKPGHLLVWKDGTLTDDAFFCYEKKVDEILPLSAGLLDELLLRTFRRLVDSVGGRQIVVPLSGGYDSRLIVTMLRRLNYENVLCYSVGREKNEESHIAACVAKNLGYPYLFINNQSQQFVSEQHLLSSHFREYAHFMGGLTNFVWLFEYPAMCYLCMQGVVDKDAVFIPGHSGDSLAGSHFQKGYVTEEMSARQMTQSIVTYSFEYDYSPRVQRTILHELKEKIQQGFVNYTVYQSFIFRNRQAHQIVNSARIYEFFCHEVRLPLLDNELVDAFMRLPWADLANCSLYNTYVCDLFKRYGVDFAKPNKEKSPKWLVTMKIWLKRCLPDALVGRMIHIHDVLCEYELSAPLRDELVKEGVYHTRNSFFSINSIMKDWYLLQVRDFLREN